MNSKTPARYTLNDINSRRDALRAEMLASSERITDLWHDLVTPPPADSKSEILISNFQRGFAIFDGVMTGYKILRRFGMFIPKRKRNRH